LGGEDRGIKSVMQMKRAACPEPGHQVEDDAGKRGGRYRRQESFVRLIGQRLAGGGELRVVSRDRNKAVICDLERDDGDMGSGRAGPGRAVCGCESIVSGAKQVLCSGKQRGEKCLVKLA
jgi:hypothetical protein